MQTLYYDAPSNTSRDDDDDDDDDDDEEEEDPKNCSKIAQNRVCCTLGYDKHIGTRKFLTKALWVYSHLKSEFLFLQKVT